MTYIENQLWNYAYLNTGLKIKFNDKTLYSKMDYLIYCREKQEELR